MYEITIKLMVAAALLQLGMTLSKPQDIASHSGIERIERTSRQILRVDWKPISVFPEEAKRFAGQ